MVFNLLATTNKLLQSKIAIYDSLEYRKAITAICVDFLEGRQADYIYEDIRSRDPQGVDQYYLQTYNITKLVINDISLITRTEPIRRVTNGNERDARLWAEDIKKMDWASKMVQTEKLTNLTGSPLVSVHWHEEVREDKISPLSDVTIESVTGHPCLDIITYDTYDVIVGNNLEIQELIYPISGGEFKGFGRDGSPDRNSKAVQAYWSCDCHRRIVPQVLQSEIESIETNNPYCCIPAVAFHRNPPTRYFFQPCDESLIYANNNVNLLSTIGDFISRYQSHAQPKNEDGVPNKDYQKDIGGQSPTDEFGNAVNIRRREQYLELDNQGSEGGVRKAGGVVLGPNEIIGGKFDYVTPGHNIDKLQGWIESQLRILAASHNLDPDTYIKTVIGVESGKAKWASDVKSGEASKQNRPFMAANEKRLFQVMKTVRKIHAPPTEQYSEECELEIVYRDNETPMEPQEKFGYLMEQSDKGYMGPIEVIQNMYPHLTREEAIEKFETIQEERQEYQIVSISPDTSMGQEGQNPQDPNTKDLQSESMKDETDSEEDKPPQKGSSSSKTK